MQKTNIDNETIDTYLVCGDDADFVEALKMIDTKFKPKIVEVIRKKALSANEHDLLDIYQEVLSSIFECAKKGTYNPGAQKLENFIRTIAYRRAIDWVRKKCDTQEEYNTDKIIDSVNQIVSESKYGFLWEKAQNEEKINLILSTILKLIPQLKHRQRQVAEVIIEDFPKYLEDANIKERILQRYGEEVSIIAVRRSKQEVLSKVKEALPESGCGDDINE
jgi:DNA-directed RNA polymerase specialized sigma24 family protein